MSSLRKLAVFLRPYWKQAIIAPLLMLIEVAMDLSQPRLMQQIIDVGIAQLNMSVVIKTGLLMVGLALLGALGGSGNTIFAVKVSQGVGTDLRSKLFRKLQSLSFSNLDKLETGGLMTRLINDVAQIQQIVLVTLRIMIRGPLMLFGSLIMAIMTCPELSFLLALLIPISLSMLIWVVKRAHPLFMEMQRGIDGVNRVMQENLAGIRVVKAFVREDYEKKRFEQVNDNLMNRSIRAMQLVAVARPFTMLILNLGVVGVIWFGGVQVKAGNITVGQIMAFVNYLMRTLHSLVMVSMLLTRIPRAEASAERILEVLNNEPKIRSKPNAIRRFSPKGRVAFEHVSFSYSDRLSDPVLRDISFVVEPAQTVVILGPTGSGKSSLLYLIPRFYDVTEGRVTIDGIDVRDLAEEELRHNIGFVFQEPILFSGTIRENICYGCSDVSDEEVITAAKIAQIHDFVVTLPQGYNTVVGQRGVNLSGGQKQRIAIARALIIKPAILILDDCTSAVDVETESRIWDGLTRMMKNTTIFIVTQRVSTALRADKILVLDNGTVVAEGTHAELMESNAIYREIYESQLGSEVEINA